MTAVNFRTHLLMGALQLLVGLAGVVGAADAPAPAASKALPIAELTRTNAVDFEKEVLPMLRTSCLACHNRTKAKANLILETPADILKGGESGPAVVPKKGSESMLLRVSAHLEKPFMPPRDNKVEAVDLTAEQLGLMKLWIDQGATGDVKGSSLVEWQPLPPGINPILAVALTEDAQILACGRANQLSLYHLPTQRLITRLSDPALQKSGLYPKAGVAHRDMVNSLAFSHDGLWLASGDYQAVKLWHRDIKEERKELKSPGLKPATAVASAANGHWVATGHADGTLALWDGSNGNLKTQWVAHGHAIEHVAFSPTGDRLLSSSGSQRVGIWNPQSATNIVWISGPAPVTAAAWHAEGNKIITAGVDKALRVWTLPSGAETNAVQSKEFTGHGGTISSLSIAQGVPNLLASGSFDGTVLLWDLEKGGSPRKADHGSPVVGLALRPDGKLFASSGSNGVTRIWQVSDVKSLRELKGDRFADDAVGAVERAVNLAKAEISYREGVLEEAKKRAKTEADYAAKILENRLTAERTLTDKQKASLAAMEARAAAEKAPAELAAELAKVNAEREAAEKPARDAEAETANARQRADRAKATAESARKAATDLEAAVKADAGKTPSLAAAKAAADKVATEAAQLFEDAKIVADRFAKDAEPRRKAAEEAKANAQKRIADIAERQKKVPEKLAAALKAQETAEKETDTALAGKRSAEDQLVSAQRASKRAADAVPEAEGILESARQSLKKSEQQLQVAKQTAADAVKPARTLEFGADGTTLLIANGSGRLQSWSVDTGIGVHTTVLTPAPLSTFTLGGPNTLWALSTNGALTSIQRSEEWSLARILGTDDASSPLKARINALQFSPDGSQLAVGSGEPTRSGELTLWDYKAGKLLRSFTNAHSDVVLSLDYSPDSKFIASAAADRFVKVWDLSTGKMSRSFEGHTHHVLGVSWRPDGRTLASAGADKLIKLWNFVTGEQKRTIGGAEKEVTSIAYVEASNEALVTSGDSQVRLVSDDGKTVRSFGTGSDFVQSAAVTRDGKWVVGGGQDSILRVWDGRNGQLVKAFDP